MKKSIYRSTLLIVLFSLLVFIGGCTLIPKSVRKDLIVDYLNDKYTDDHFEFVRYSGGKPWSYEALTIECKSEKYPEKAVMASYIPEDNKYYDNYLGVKYSKQLDEYVENIGKELFPEHKTKHSIYSDNSKVPPLLDMSADTDFEDYLANCGENVFLFCEYDKDELNANKEEICERTKELFQNLDMNVNHVGISFTNNIDRDLDFVRGDAYNCLFIEFNYDNGKRIESIEWGE